MNEINKLERLIESLATQAIAYDRSNKIPQLASRPYFVAMLFKCQSSQLGDYVDETRGLLAQVKHYIAGNSAKTLIEFQCNKLVEQCQAIRKVLSSQTQRYNNYRQDKTSKAKFFANKQKNGGSNFNWLSQKVVHNSRLLYEELSKHHGYQEKLNAKISQLSHQLDSCPTDKKIDMQKQILHQHKRLGQCNKAIYFIEKKIQQLESGKKLYY